jgi:hypothetical protein
MKGHIVTKPKLMDNRRITFSLFEETNGREIICQTMGDNNAPNMLKEISEMKHVEIEGNWIPTDRGASIMFRVESVKNLEN